LSNKLQDDVILDATDGARVIWRDSVTDADLFSLEYTPVDPSGILQAPKNALAGGPAGLFQNIDGLTGWRMLSALVTTHTIVSSATPAIDTDTTDEFTITGLATAITSMTLNLTGAPVNGQPLIVRILDNGVAHAIAWGAAFASRGVSLPITTVAGKYLYVGLIWNSTTNTWDCISVAQEV